MGVLHATAHADQRGSTLIFFRPGTLCRNRNNWLGVLGGKRPSETTNKRVNMERSVYIFPLLAN